MVMIDANRYKQTLGSFPTGVCVITMPFEDTFHGITISSLSAVSLSPPLVSFCIEHNANSYQLLENTNKININILGASQQDICWHFAKHGKWREDFPYEHLEGLPAFINAAATMHCNISQRIKAGDHDIIICEVVDSVANLDVKPMVYVRGKII